MNITQSNQPFSIYCDWGMHDELGDSQELSESMTFRALDSLERWKKQFGIAFDYYLIDCFWFDPERGYRFFKQPHWPDGFEPALTRIRELGMKPGLWYSTNGYRLNNPAWDDSLCEGNWAYSLVDGSYAENFQASMIHAIDEWEIAFIKLDFANLDLAAKGVKRASDATYAESVKRLKSILRAVRQHKPDIRILTHCGYARADHGIGPNGYASPGNDPSWLEVADYLFSGDPAPSSAPRYSLRRSCDLFQDANTYRVYRDGLPLHRIDDHGVMVGETNTCLYQGRVGFRRTHLAQLARGARRDFFYGDPTLLTDDDLVGMRQTRCLFFDAYSRGLETAFIGGGEPGFAPWHAFLTGGGDRGLLYLVNGKSESQLIEMDLPGIFEARSLFCDGCHPAVQVQADRLNVELAPEQVALIGLGKYANEEHLIGSGDDLAPSQSRLAQLQFTPEKNGYSANVEGPAGDMERLAITVTAMHSTARRGPLWGPPHNFARQSTKPGESREPLAPKIVNVELIRDGRAVGGVRTIPAVPVWTGLNWFRAIVDAQPGDRIQIQTDFGDAPKEIRTHVRANWIRESE